MQIVVTGGIRYKERDFIRDCLISCIAELPVIPTFRVRDTRAYPDGIVVEFCKEFDIPYYVLPRRSAAMGTYREFDVPGENALLLAGASLLLAFPGSTGTLDCTTQAMAADIQVIKFDQKIFDMWKFNARYRKYKL